MLIFWVKYKSVDSDRPGREQGRLDFSNREKEEVIYRVKNKGPACDSEEGGLNPFFNSSDVVSKSLL